MKRKLLFLGWLSLIIVPVALIALAIIAPEWKPRLDVRTAEPEGWDEHKIALRYAPVFLQQIAERPELARYDYVCAMNFDGDWKPHNNLKNLESLADFQQMKAVAYYALVESETHFFLTYSVYHPLEWDYGGRQKEDWCDNSIENLQVLVRKEARNDISGQVELVAIQRPAGVFYYGTPMSSFHAGKLDIEPQQVVLTDDAGIPAAKGTHPLLVLRSGRHKLEMPDNCRELFRNGFRLKNGITYLSALEGKMFDTGNPDQTVPYTLESIGEQLWEEPARESFFQDSFHYEDQHGLFSFTGVPASPKSTIYSKTWAAPSITPFAFGKGSGQDGELFFHPVLAYGDYFRIQGRFSLVYLYHPYAVPH